ncbi:MAG: PDZ domain-containing protein [Dehalococcoidia bacterium]|nr:PDZ domain-containing protein [Dehalococcoidia bacterium]
MRELKWIPIIVASVALGAASVIGIDALRSDEGQTTVIERTSSGGDGATISTSISDVADLYDAVRPSVVRITTQGARAGMGGLGSGVVIDKEGHILTNNHVIDGASQIDVTLIDGLAARAEVVGADPGNDLAVIKVDLPSDQLEPASLGDSSAVRAGEFVIAVGNPFGIEASVTEGIVSGIGRTLSSGGGRPLRQLIQSDAAINPGNSGGGLFNSRGELIGITTAIENPSGDRVFVGIGYAVPVNTAERFLPDLLAGRQVQHPRMGVSLQDLTPALAGRLGIDVQQGVMITQVENGSAASRAGLRGSSSSGDIIVALDGEDVRSFEELANYIDSKKVGDKVEVTIWRDGEETTLEITLEAWRSGGA